MKGLLVKMQSFKITLANSVAKFGLEPLYKVFCYSGLEGVWYRIVWREQMKKCIAFYSNPEVIKRIKRICAHLSDDESKKTYQKVIKFCQRRLNRDRPHETYPQYFIPELQENMSEAEIFVDGGGYTGDTYRNFIEWSHNKYAGYVFFEPSIRNLRKFEKTVNDKRISFHNEGLWNEEAKLYFSGGVSGGERIIQEPTDKDGNAVPIKVTAIDVVPECENATFIKMDIEGAEMNALLGGINTIKRNRPKLAISIYHSNEDMLRIPEWCINNLENYHFYIRHHHYLPGDTVFYAIPTKIY